jgi:hypothetical protein
MSERSDAREYSLLITAHDRQLVVSDVIDGVLKKALTDVASLIEREVHRPAWLGVSARRGVAEDAHKPSASHPQLRRKPAIGLLILMRRPRFSCRCERRDDHELRRPVGHRLVGAEARLEIDRVHRFEITPLRKSMARTMHLEIYSMRVAEAPKRRRLVDAESFARGLTELRTEKHGADTACDQPESKCSRYFRPYPCKLGPRLRHSKRIEFLARHYMACRTEAAGVIPFGS